MKSLSLMEAARLRARDLGGSLSEHIDDIRRERGEKYRWGYQAGEGATGTVSVEYIYHDERNKPYLCVQRTSDKRFLQQHWNGQRWEYGAPAGPKFPYMLPELLKSQHTEPVFIAEGEKDVESLIDIGLVATCSSGGAGKWTPDLNQWFAKRTSIFVLADNDEPGRRHALQVADNLYKIVSEVRIVALPNLEAHGDVTDWLAAGGTKEQLLDYCRKAPLHRGSLVLDPSDPAQAAHSIAKRDFHDAVGIRTLHRHKGEFREWNGRHYERLTEEALSSKLWVRLSEAMCEKNGKRRSLKPHKGIVANVVAALAAFHRLPDSIEAPAWLTRSDAPPPDEFFSVANGLLHLPSGTLWPPSADYFNNGSSDVSFASDASPPRKWLAFLQEVFGGDAQSQGLLQEWMGYCLSPDTSQQKILLIVGPPRSGKGTIARILGDLVGRDCAAGPTMASLSERFGLEPLISKTIAIVPDARMGAALNKNTIVERLLSISGEDNLTVDRKYAAAWFGRLPTRIAIITNELPSFTDSAGAIAGRFLTLSLTNSYYGKEDTNLYRSLKNELPSILLWALEGYRRLRERGHFISPDSSIEAVNEIADLASPIKAFLREYCEEGPLFEVSFARLLDAYKLYCKLEGIRQPPSAWFARNLRSATPKLTQKKSGSNSRRSNTYCGIQLRTDAMSELMEMTRDIM